MSLKVGGRGRGGGSGDATVANLLQAGTKRLGIQFALSADEAGADWGLLVEFRDAGEIRVELDADARTATLYYDAEDTLQEIVDATEGSGELEAALIHGTDPDAVAEPHFVAARPFVSGEPFGQFTEAYIPARALFEHAVPATADWAAAAGGSEGLRFTLGEPLEYGLDVNNYRITGHQRYQGTPDTPAQNPTLDEEDLPAMNGDQPYIGVYSSDVAARGDSEWDMSRQQFYYNPTFGHLRINAAGSNSFFSSTNQANERARYGAYPLFFPYNGSNTVLGYAFDDSAAALAYILSTNFAVGTNGDDTRYSFDRDYVYYNRDQGKVKLITGLNPVTSAARATVDLPTSATGGVRVTAADTGTGPNAWNIYAEQAGTTGVDRQGTRFRFRVETVDTALTARNFLTSRPEFSAAFYGTEDGTTPLIVSGGNAFIATWFGDGLDFSGGRNAVYQIAAVDGEPDDPIHMILDPDAVDRTMLNQETFPRETEGTAVYLGELADDAAATAALAGATTAVYYNTSSTTFAFRLTTDGGATWADVQRNEEVETLLGARPVDYTGDEWSATGIPSVASLGGTEGVLVSYFGGPGLDAIAAAHTHLYYDTDSSDLKRINPPGFLPTPALEIYYNRAAGGRLTGPDDLGDIRDYVNTHFDGLNAEFYGGADADTDVTRPFATESQFSGGALLGLQVYVDRPIAIGRDGNDHALLGRQRFLGSADQAETQATLDIFTDIGRARGIRITLEAGIQGLNEHGAEIDISSGALGNAWTFEVVSPTDVRTGEVGISTGLRTITYYAHTASEGAMDTAVQLLDACNAGGTGVTAAYFGTGNAGTDLIFAGSLGRINDLQQHFSGGFDDHPGGAADPIAVTLGPRNAFIRVPFGTGGYVVELTNPAADAGNGWVLEWTENSIPRFSYIWSRDDERRIITFTNNDVAPANLEEALARLTDDIGITVTFDGDPAIIGNAGLPLRTYEFTGGLDEHDIEIQYAPVAGGMVSDPDTMGAVKAVIDAVEGLESFYYGGAGSTTVANRSTPWEHDFEDGDSEDFDTLSFALGPATNVFTGSDRAAAEAARNNYAGANPAWVIAYRGNPRLWISLRWGSAGDQVGQVLRAEADNPPGIGDWVDQHLALKGEKGDSGASYADGITILGSGSITDRFRVSAEGIRDLLDTLLGGTHWRDDFSPQPQMTYRRFIGWSQAAIPTDSELANAVPYTSNVLTIPPHATDDYLFFGLQADAPDPSEAFFDGNSHDILGGFPQRADRTLGAITYHVWSSNAEQSASILGTGSRTLTLR